MEFNLTNNNTTLNDIIKDNDGSTEVRQAITIVFITVSILAIIIFICCLSAQGRGCVCLYCFASSQVLQS